MGEDAYGSATPAGIMRLLAEYDIAIGYDGRLSGPAYSRALARGIQQSGIHVIDIGRVTTPMASYNFV